MRHAVILAALLALSCSSVERSGSVLDELRLSVRASTAPAPRTGTCAGRMQSRRSSRASSRACSPTPCLRDGVLRVEAAISDDKELAGVGGGARSRPGHAQGRAGAARRALGRGPPLRHWPFEAFSRAVVASVVARDGARNEAAATAAAVEVTRLRWERDG